MSDIYLSETDGGTFVQNKFEDISQDDTIQSFAYKLLFTGSSPLDVIFGRSNQDSFEESLNTKINVQNNNKIRQAAEELLQPMIDQKIVLSFEVRIENPAIEKREIFLDFTLPNDTEYSVLIAVIENGVIVT